MIRLIVCYYPDKNKERDLENIRAISNNIQCKSIDEVILLLEGNCRFPEYLPEKVIVQPQISRPTIREVIEIGNKRASNTDITVFCNTDIYFDNSLSLAHQISKGEVFALSRYEFKDSEPKLFARYDSQDAWIFKGRINTSKIGNFYFGVPACDNVLVQELINEGYKVSNPCFSIRCYHLHASVYREYHTNKTKVAGNKAYLFPTSLSSTLTKQQELIRRDVLYDYYNFQLKNSHLILHKVIPTLGRIYYFKWKRHLQKLLFNKPIINYSAH